VRTARDALVAAGYTQRDQDDLLADRLGKPVPALELIYPDSSKEAEAIAVYLRQQYQQLGLMVNLNKLDSATYQKRRAAGQYDLDIGLVYLPGASDPDDFKAQFISKGSLNFTGYSNPQVDSLFADGLKLSPDSNQTQRRQIYEKLQQIVADDSPVFFLYTLQAYTVMTNNVDPGGAGIINLPRWQLAWDAYPAYLNWYLKDAP
jgi:peptide/nickel transport system substrate-binding protein